MDSRRVSFSAAQGTPIVPAQPFEPRKRALSSSVLSSSLPIRAPITVDDDSDFESNNNKFENTSSGGSSVSGDDSGSEYEVFANGEEFETASESERPLVADPDKLIVGESDFDGKDGVFRPFVAYPDEESLQFKNRNLKLVRPIAQLSWEDDDGSEVEDEFSLRSVEVVEKIRVAPRIKIFEVEEGKDDESMVQTKSLIVNLTENFDSDIFVEAENSFSTVKDEKLHDVEDFVEDVLVEETSGGGAVHEEPLEANKSDDVELNSELIEHVKLFSDEEHKFKDFDTRNTQIEDSSDLELLEEENDAVQGFYEDTDKLVANNLVEKEEADVDKGGAEDNLKNAVEDLLLCDSELLNTQIEDSSDSELLKEENDAVQGFYEDTDKLVANNLVEKEEADVDKGGAEDNLKNAVEDLLVCENGNKSSSEGAEIDAIPENKMDAKVDEIPESKMDAEISFNHVKDDSLAAMLESTEVFFEADQKEFDFKTVLVTDEAEDIVDYCERDLSVAIGDNETAEGTKDTDEVEELSHVSDEDAEDLAHGGLERTEKIIVEMEEKVAAASHLGTISSEDHSEESIEFEGDKSGPSMNILNTTTVVSPSNFDSSLHSEEAASQQTHLDTLTPLDLSGDEIEVNLSEEEKKTIVKIQSMRVKFLRLVHRLGISLEDSKVTQVLDRLVLDVEKHTNHFSTLESTKKMALDFEADNRSELDFCLNILVLGKSGVGKSATINFLFGEKKAIINAFKPATTSSKVIVGTVDGVKIRILDTPGLKVPAVDQAANQKMLSTINKYIKKFPPDVVFYVDRLDTQNRDNDLPLLRSITRCLGSSIWKNAIVTLTHADSVPPDGPSGLPVGRDIFVAQKYHGVLQSISVAVGNFYLMNSSFMHPLALVENNPQHSDSSSWRSQLLLLCLSLKVLSEASSITMREKPSDPRKFMGVSIHSSVMHYLLSSLLQSRAHPNIAESDTEFADLVDLESEDEDEYDQLPSFRPLSRSEIAKLSKEQKKSYFEEYDYRVKLLQRKQWKEEIRRLREIKTNGKDDGALIGHDFTEDEDKEDSNPTSKSVPLPDSALPPSFDGEEPAYRYRSLNLLSELLVTPVMETYCWDHDCGYNGVNLEKEFVVSDRFPTAFSFQIIKDKKKLNVHLDSSLSMKHGESRSTLAGLDIQTVGKQLAYTLRGETKVRNCRINKTTAGLSVTFIGENLATGFKVEDQIAIGKLLVLASSAGVMQSQGNSAYGANLELHLNEKDFPIGEDQSNLGLSLMKSKGDLALTAFLQSQFSMGRNSKMAIHIGLNHRRSGQISIKTSSSDQIQIALVGVLPVMLSIFRSVFSTQRAQHSTS